MNSDAPQTAHSPYKSESAALSRESVAGDVNIAHLPAPLEHTPQILWRGAVREVVYFQGHHAVDAGRRPTVTHFGTEANTLAATGVNATLKDSGRLTRQFVEPTAQETWD